MKTKYVVLGLAAVSLLAAGCSKDTSKMDDKGMKDADSAMMQSDDKMMAKDDAMMSQEGVMVGGAMMLPSKDIVDNAMMANNVTTLVAAVKAAGLVETLKGPGPFTVFGPTDDAFKKLPAGTVDSLLKPENKAKLSGILTYHVVPGRYMAKDLKDGMMLKTVQGETLKVTIKDGKVMVGNATVSQADIVSKNGITHIIDTVLMPMAK